jgi:hypothetical protein
MGDKFRSFSTVADLRRFLSTLPSDMPLFSLREWEGDGMKPGCCGKVVDVVELSFAAFPGEPDYRDAGDYEVTKDHLTEHEVERMFEALVF